MRLDQEDRLDFMTNVRMKLQHLKRRSSKHRHRQRGSSTPLDSLCVIEIWRRNIDEIHTPDPPQACLHKCTHTHTLTHSQPRYDEDDCVDLLSGRCHPKHNHSSAWPVFEPLSPGLCETSAPLPETASSTYSPVKQMGNDRIQQTVPACKM